MQSPEQVFTNIFTNKIWGDKETVSGDGSTNHYSRAFGERFEVLLKGLNIKTMIDSPCGDGNFINNVDITGIEYHGYDVVPDLIEINKERFKDRNNMKHQVADVTEADLPSVDLIFSRDLLIHLPNEIITKALNNFKRSGSKWIMTTHFYELPEWGSHINSFINLGDWHPVNLCHAPFHLPHPILSIPELQEGKTMALWDLQNMPL